MVLRNQRSHINLRQRNLSNRKRGWAATSVYSVRRPMIARRRTEIAMSSKSTSQQTIVARSQRTRRRNIEIKTETRCRLSAARSGWRIEAIWSIRRSHARSKRNEKVGCQMTFRGPLNSLKNYCSDINKLINVCILKLHDCAFSTTSSVGFKILKQICNINSNTTFFRVSSHTITHFYPFHKISNRLYALSQKFAVWNIGWNHQRFVNCSESHFGLPFFVISGTASKKSLLDVSDVSSLFEAGLRYQNHGKNTSAASAWFNITHGTIAVGDSENLTNCADGYRCASGYGKMSRIWI